MASYFRRETNLFASTGLLGTCIIALVEYSSIPELSKALFVSATCFAVAIPILALYVETLTHIRKDEAVPANPWTVTLVVGGYVLAYVGIAALFYHFDTLLCVAFVVVSVAAFSIFPRSTN